MSDADAARRRELQRRLYAPGGALTPEETEELRMLSAPSSADDHASAASATAEPDADAARVGTHGGRTSESDVVGERSLLDDRNDPSAGPSMPGPVYAAPPGPSVAIEKPASPSVERYRPRWLIPAVAAAALVVGLGIGWMTVPHPAARAAPAMSAEQQKIQREIITSGEVDAGTLEFAGEQYGASVWTASRGKERCVVIAAQEQRSTACGGTAGYPRGDTIAAGVNGLQEGDTTRSVNALLTRTITGDWTVFVQQWEVDVNDDSWQQQYSDAEMRLVGALQDAGFDGQNLTILGRDGDLPIWFDYDGGGCVAVVDPETLEIAKACGADGSTETVELPYREAVYSVKWTERRGPVLTIIRGPQAITTVVCDTDGTCNPIDEDEN